MLAGVLLAVLPHLLRLGRTGDPTWLSDIDELVPYGQQVSFAHHQHPWRMGDPALERGGATVFPWIQFGPYLIGARALGTGPMGTFILMRIWAGASLALGFHLALRGDPPGLARCGALDPADFGSGSPAGNSPDDACGLGPFDPSGATP
jgi:hypothetical protein